MGRSRRFVRVFDWLDRGLFPVLGPPPLGPFGHVGSAEAEAKCPICTHPMREHLIDHSHPNAVLLCPAPHTAAFDREDFSPLNEMGMTMRPGAAERASQRSASSASA